MPPAQKKPRATPRELPTVEGIGGPVHWQPAPVLGLLAAASRLQDALGPYTQGTYLTLPVAEAGDGALYSLVKGLTS